MPLLIVTTPDGARAFVRLQVGKKRLIGSHPRCSVRLAPDVAEPFHCEVLYAFGLWQVRDLGTVTGTSLNGRSITQDSLASGDTIEIGEARLSFRVESQRAGVPSRRSSTRGRTSHELPRRRAVTQGSRRVRSPGAPVFVVACALVGLLVVGLVLLGRRTGPTDGGGVASTREPSPAPAVSPVGSASRGVPTPDPGVEAPVSQSPAGAEPSVSRGDLVEPSESPGPLDVAAVEPPEPASQEAGAGFRGEISAELPQVGEPSSERYPPREAAQWREETLSALTALDFEAVETLLEGGRSKGIPQDVYSAIEAECREVRVVWDELLGGLEAATRKKTLCDVSRDVSLASSAPSVALRVSLKPELGLKVNALEGDVAELVDGRGRRIGAARVSSLPDEVLVRMLTGVRKPSPQEEEEARRRLARLLLHAEGPERARASWAEASSPDELTSGVALQDDGSDRWLRRRLRAVRLHRLRLEQSGEREPAAWARLCGEILPLLALTTPTAASVEQSQRLREDFAHARSLSLPLEAIFRAAQVERLPDGRVRLAFDFKSEKAALEQAADLHTVGFQTEAPRYARGRLVLQGEYRLLEGEPFVDRLSVEGKAVPLTPDSPNVNLALWTQSSDSVTCLDGESSSWFSLLRQSSGQPSDYFVFGMGYRAVTWRLVDQAAEQVVLASSREAVALPAFVLLAGSRGATLHKDLGECLVAEPAPPERTRRVDFLVEFKGGEVTWRVNGRVLALDSEVAQTRLRAKTGRTGSVSILTNGQPVAVEALEVVGQLAEEWVQARAQETVARELARESPGVASP